MPERRASSSIWPRAGPSICQVSLSRLGPPAPTTSTSVGSTGGETIVGTSQSDTIFTGGGGIDVLTGGGGRRYVRLHRRGRHAGNWRRNGTNGSVTGFGLITDFAPGATAAASELLGFSARSIGISFTTNNSTLLLHTGAPIRSHTISNGIVTFNDITGSQSLITLGDVAAATQYLSCERLGQRRRHGGLHGHHFRSNPHFRLHADDEASPVS